MISFALDEEQALVRDTVRKFASDVIRPNARAWERAAAVPDDARRTYHELGLPLLDVPESIGGGGGSAFLAALVHEELGFGDAGSAVALHGPSQAGLAVALLGDAEQGRRLLAPFAASTGALVRGAVAWSEPLAAASSSTASSALPLEGFSARAEKDGDGYLLHGEKRWVIHGGIADLTIVFAQVDPDAGWRGVGAFAVEGPLAAPAPDIRQDRRQRLLGLETVHVAQVSLDGIRVPETNRLRGGGDGLDIVAAMQQLFARAALHTAARQVGLARAAYEYALAYTQERKAFGKPVAHFQAIAFTLAEMLMDVESARWMVWRAACDVDRGAACPPSVAAAAVQANEAAWRVADNGVQLLGGAGFIQDHPSEKWLRDTKALALTAPTDQLQQMVLARAAVGGAGAADVDLPSVALQPIIT